MTTQSLLQYLVRPQKGRLLRPQAVHLLGDLGRHLGCCRHTDSIAGDDVLEHRVLREYCKVAYAMVIVFDLVSGRCKKFIRDG